jgi:hypothetical protein
MIAIAVVYEVKEVWEGRSFSMMEAIRKASFCREMAFGVSLDGALKGCGNRRWGRPILA